MNGKRSKALRRQSYNLVITYVKDRLLTPDQYEGATDKELLKAVPDLANLRQAGQVKNGILSKRWFYKQVKKNPEVSYEELLKKAGINTPTTAT